MSTTTGETCIQSGTYVATCKAQHPQQIRLNQGEIFPPCGHVVAGQPCSAIVAWTMKPKQTH
jgi:hypothetical protein